MKRGFVLELHWMPVGRFARLQPPAILAQYANVNDRKGKGETR